MSGAEIAEAVAGGVLGIGGIVSAVRTMARVKPGDPPKVRTLIALHALAKAGFWIGLGAIFFAYAFRASLPGSPQVLFPIPLVMAGVRLLTAHALIRALPPDE